VGQVLAPDEGGDNLLFAGTFSTPRVPARLPGLARPKIFSPTGYSHGRWCIVDNLSPR
jgi:hypothetical protein